MGLSHCHPPTHALWPGEADSYPVLKGERVKGASCRGRNLLFSGFRLPSVTGGVFHSEIKVLPALMIYLCIAVLHVSGHRLFLLLQSSQMQGSQLLFDKKSISNPLVVATVMKRACLTAQKPEGSGRPRFFILIILWSLAHCFEAADNTETSTFYNSDFWVPSLSYSIYRGTDSGGTRGTRLCHWMGLVSNSLHFIDKG